MNERPPNGVYICGYAHQRWENEAILVGGALLEGDAGGLSCRYYTCGLMQNVDFGACLGSTWTKIGTLQRLACLCPRMTSKFMELSVFKKKKET